MSPDDNTCPDCGRKPITGLEVAIIVGYTALVVAFTLIAVAVLL